MTFAEEKRRVRVLFAEREQGEGKVGE